MQRMLCRVLCLTIFSSLLPGCATVPAPKRPAVSGPQVYGYSLNQPLSAEQVRRLSDTGKHFAGSLKLYQQVLEDGSQFGFYTNFQNWLDTLTRTSRAFSLESDCLVAQQADQAQLQKVVDDFNAGQARPDGAPRQEGDVYARQALEACQRIGGEGAEAEAFRYTLWATLQTQTAAPASDFPPKLEETHTSVWEYALVGVLLAVVVVGVVLVGRSGNTSYFPGDGKEHKAPCDKEKRKKAECF